MLRLLVSLLLVSSISFANCGHCQDVKPKTSDGKWIQLFNGKNLDGWTPKIRGYDLGENFGNTFRVSDGKIQVGFEKYDQFKERFGHLQV